MRKSRGEVAAVFTAFAVILAAGVSSTAQIPVVCAEEGNDDGGANALPAEENNDGSANALPAEGNDGGSANALPAEEGDGQAEDHRASEGTGQNVAVNADSAGGTAVNTGSSGANSADSNDKDNTEIGNTGSSMADTETDTAESGTGDGAVEGDDETASDTQSNTNAETDENGLPLTRSISTFSLENNRSGEEISVEFSDVGMLNSQLEIYADKSPVKAMPSGNITSADGPILVGEGNTLTLDLDGNSISSDSLVVLVDGGGSLTITGGGTLKSAKGPVVNVTNGKFVLESGDITADSGNAIVVEDGGNVEIKDGTVSGKNSAMLVNGGEVEIRGGTISGESSAILIDGGAVEMKGGTVKADSSADVHAIHVNSGKLAVSSGSISGDGGAGTGALLIQGGNAEITGGSWVATAPEYGFACYATRSGKLTITGGTFTLNAPAGKSLYIDSSEPATVSGGSYNKSIAIHTGVDANNAGIGEWADSFYDMFEGGVLSDNSFFYEREGIVYTNPSVSVKSGAWDRSCEETRDLTAGTSYSFASDGWTVEGDSTVYGSGSFYSSNEGTYTFSRKTAGE